MFAKHFKLAFLACVAGRTIAAPAETHTANTGPSVDLADAHLEAGSEGLNTTCIQAPGGVDAPPNNVLSLGLPAESYRDGITCGAVSGVWAEIEQFGWNIEIFCTTIDDWTLTQDTMVSTPLQVDLLNTKNPKTPGKKGYITFGFVNHGSSRPMAMTYRACHEFLSKLTCHKCGGTDCTGDKALGTKGGAYKEGDMTLSAWLHEGDLPTPHVWT